MTESPDWILDADGQRRPSPAKRNEIWARYLKPCGPALALRDSPLEEVLAKHRGCTVVEADTPFVLACHLRTALIKRRDPELGYDILPPKTLMSRLLEGTPEAQHDLVYRWDPLVLQAFYWPSYYAASQHLGNLVQTRDLQRQPTLFVVRSLDQIHRLPGELFDSEFRLWLDGCHRIQLSQASIQQNAVRPELAAAYLAQHPGFGRAVSSSMPSPGGTRALLPGNVKASKSRESKDPGAPASRKFRSGGLP